MKRGHGIGLSSLYEAIAAGLVFKLIARPIDLLALERAVELEIHDPSFGRPPGAATGSDDDELATIDDGRHESDVDEGLDENNDDDSDADPGEAVSGHAPFTPDATRNTPRPGPIPSRPSRASRRLPRSDRASGSVKGEGDAKAVPEFEKEHIEALKRNHYASHCQMCLCERPPRELAPPGSYVQWEEVRRRVVEAHHVDLKSAGGARHAGNLILLCKLHHDNYGRRLTRAAITAALQSEATDRSIRFDAGSDTVREIKGRQITLAISDSKETIKIFFTKEHAAYWISQAKPVADATDAGQNVLVSPSNKGQHSFS